jgi:hypothetical protein
VPDDKQETPKLETQEIPRRCPACGAFPRLTHQFLDAKRGKTIRLYQCQCGERIWDD